MKYSFLPISECCMCGASKACFVNLGMRLNRTQGMRPKEASGIAVSIKHCSSCGLNFADPQPIPASIDDHYGLPPETYWKNLSSTVPQGYFQRQIAETKGLIGFQDGMAALDIGVGQGHASVALGRAGFDVTGIEPSAPFRDFAIATHGLDPNGVKHAPLEEVEFPPEKFDFINFGAVLEHLYDPAAALARCLPWLKPQGIIHAEVPSSRHLMARIINAYFRIRGTNYVTNLSPMHPPYHLFSFGLESFQIHGGRAGYSIARHYYSVCSIRQIPKLLHPPLRWWMERTNTGLQLTVYLRKGT